ncbi:6-phosphogluconolactonase [Vulcanococcus sp.]|uniref:6-phosphogluconolactonase n=1 Tax=Vulcanococcus sp. TaxID=2856995 RepID=UPI003F697FE3
MTPSPTSYKLEVASDASQLARVCAERIASLLDLALDQRDRAHLALSGGTTPAAAYRVLNQEHLPWNRVDVVLGDERWVPPTDPASNARMLRDTLMAPGGPGADACFHPVPTELENPAASVDAFERYVRGLCPGDPPMFDVMLLGLGDDGHTASLFPGTPATEERTRLVTIGAGKGLERISLTAPVLSAARQVIFLVRGAAKRQALQRLLDPGEQPQRTPAKLVQPQAPVLVLADTEAAQGL